MKSMLKMGSKGDAVKEMQQMLINHGFLSGRADGDFGPGTRRAVVAYQKAKGLMSDGIAGPRVLASLRGYSTDTWQLTDRAIENAARDLGVDIASIRTVSEVESLGSGFIKADLPKILFERHIMNRRLIKNKVPLAAEMARDAVPDLVNTKTGSYIGGKREWSRLRRAMEINYISAIESASYGRYQLMGFHWIKLGYSSAQEFLDLMCKSEDEHLNAFVRFIKNNKRLWDALIEKDWIKFARYYNGPSYAKNKYDIKLAEAYKRHSIT